MIRQRSALSRNIQDFFHRELLGLYRFEEVVFQRPIPAEREPGKRFDQGRFRDVLKMQFGPFDLHVYGSDEIDDRVIVEKGVEPPRFPCGQILLISPHGEVSGPLDPTTWSRVAAHIKENRQEERETYEHEAGDPWGR